MKQAKVIAIANQKGGVGKTTTTINLGAGLAGKNYRVLVIDLDSQAHLAIGLGYNSENIEKTLYTIIDNAIKNDGDIIDTINNFIIKTDIKNLNLLASDINLSSVELGFQGLSIGRESILNDIINQVKSEYDYILLDCPPALGNLTINALSAANYVIIPMNAAIFDVDGSKKLIKTIFQVKKKINTSLKILGILITKYDGRTRHAKEVLEGLKVLYGDNVRVFDTKISQSVRVAESNFEGQSIFAYAPKGKISQEYNSLLNEVIKYVEME